MSWCPEIAYTDAMETIDVSELPEPIARAIAEQVQYWRAQAAKRRAGRPPVLPRWPGIAPPPAELRRCQLYENVG